MYADLWGRGAVQRSGEFDRKIELKSLPRDLVPYLKFPTSSIDFRKFLNLQVRPPTSNIDLFDIFRFVQEQEKIGHSSFSSSAEGLTVTMTAARVPGGPPYTFMYRGKIENARPKPVRLLSRSYEFVNAQGQVETKVPKNSVAACGVVGHTPLIGPGENFVFYSGVTLSTGTGLWRGQFQLCEDDEDFDVDEVKTLPLVQRYAVLTERGVNKFEVDLPVVRFSPTLTQVLDPLEYFMFCSLMSISFTNNKFS
jgi:uncharacterized protein affecting Mg2+/Co2+ transport